MYGRKIKLMTGKKKSKASAPGQAWGPRVALAEKEKALSSLTETTAKYQGGSLIQRKQNSYQFHPSQKPKENCEKEQRCTYKKVSISTSSSHSHTGSSSANNYIYNYARKASTSGSSETSKSFFLSQYHPPPLASSSRSSSNKNSYGGSTYILGSNSGSHVTLSGSTIDVATKTSRPLTLIIPSAQNRFNSAGNFEHGLEMGQDSFPSTRTYKSSSSEDDEEEGDADLTLISVNDTSKNNPLPSKSQQVFANAAINNFGILKVSTTKPMIHHQVDASTDGKTSSSDKKQKKKTDVNKIKQCIISDLQNICNGKNKSNSVGSTISSLAQGITMVYVPMESLPRSKSAAVLNASLEFDPDLSRLVKDAENDIAALACCCDEESEFPQNEENDNDPDNDSLLESFDSVMFKPRDGQHLPSPDSSISSNCLSPPLPMPIYLPNVTIISNVNCEPSQNDLSPQPTEIELNNNVRRTLAKNTPPPLPPKNPCMLKPKLKINDNMFANIAKRNNSFLKPQLEPPSATQRAINIRTAVENLENIIRPQSTTAQKVSEEKGATKGKRVTLTIPPETLAREQELLNNLRNDTDTEIDVYSSTFLTCGHVLKEDDYSTLSSTPSPTVRASQNDLDHLQQSLSSSAPSPSSGGECSPNTAMEKNRSVLQQLRELSILIGGNFADNKHNKDNNNISAPMRMIQSSNISFRLHDSVDSTRKISDATDNSADSGKGSGTGSSPKSFNSSPDSLQIHVSHAECPAVTSPCVFRSDCNECLMFNKPKDGFDKPNNSEEICGKAVNATSASSKITTLRKSSTGSSSTSSKKSTPSKIVRRKSNRSSKSSNKATKYKKKKQQHLILDYCECSSCCCEGRQHETSSQNPQGNEDPASVSTKTSKSIENRKVSTGSSSSGHSSIKLSRSVAFRTSSRSNNNNRPKISPLSISDTSTNGLFTIEEEESQSVDSRMRKCNENKRHANFESVPATGNSQGDINVTTNTPHWHPDCWLAADPMHGWSDLESLYSLNVKNDQPLSINGECWTCWNEITEIKKNSENPNATMDRTNRLFVWLNKRHKEFQAPWWEAKKQASIRWIMTKALTHVPKEYLIDPFKESKKSKPTKYRIRDEVIKGLVSGKLYSLSLANLYQNTLGCNNKGQPQGLSHWDIIKILSRRGVYLAKPSDMKLTQGTLRQKPIRIAAHIALIEAIMGLYSKEILARERILATLYTFGCTVKPETTSPEKLVIAWINAAVMTLKSYIISTKSHQLPPEKQNRWLQIPKIDEIRDLCDGVGICSLFAIYCSNELKVCDISVPEPGETLTIYDSISNHTLIQKLCEELFPETIYHLCVTDFLYIHGYMKQNILCFLVDLFIHLEVNPVVKVNRLTHVPIRVDLA